MARKWILPWSPLKDPALPTPCFKPHETQVRLLGSRTVNEYIGIKMLSV